jgi:hypothetical protein
MQEDAKDENQKSNLINVASHEEKKKIRLLKPEKNMGKDFGKWVGVGLLVSIIFAFLGITNNRAFLVLIPLGPTGAIIAWFIKKIMKKYEDKDLLSS